jgi:hypothetical protein
MISLKINTIRRAIGETEGKEPSWEGMAEIFGEEIKVPVSKDTITRSWLKESKVHTKWLPAVEQLLRAHVPVIGSDWTNDLWARFDNHRYDKKREGIHGEYMGLLKLVARAPAPDINAEGVTVAADYALARGLLGFLSFRQYMENGISDEALMEAAHDHLKIAIELMQDIQQHASQVSNAPSTLSIDVWQARFNVSYVHIGIERFNRQLVEDATFRCKFIEQADQLNYTENIELLMDLSPHYYQGPHGAMFVWALRHWGAHTTEDAQQLCNYYRAVCEVEPRLKDLNRGVNETIKALRKEPILVAQQHALKIIGEEQ